MNIPSLGIMSHPRYSIEQDAMPLTQFSDSTMGKSLGVPQQIPIAVEQVDRAKVKNGTYIYLSFN